MLLSRSATVIALALTGLAFTQMSSEAAARQADGKQTAGGMAAQDTPPANCPVTLPTERSFVSPSAGAAGAATDHGIAADGTVREYGTEKLWTLLPTDGVWRGSIPSKPWEFAYSNKLPWFRLPFSGKDGQLTITGKRLDGPAPSFKETNESSFFPSGAMIMGGINIPVFGCWEITGRLKDQELSFTVWVAPLAEDASPSVEPLPEISQEKSASEHAPRLIHGDSEVQAKELVYQVTPEIPHEAQVANVSGSVVLHAVINTSGRAVDLRYVSGPSLLAQAAIDAVHWWQYRVAFADAPNTNQPADVDTTIRVEFPAAHN